MKVCLVYATPNKQTVLEIELEQGASISRAIEVSNIQTECEGIDLNRCVYAIWGKSVDISYELKDGDRIEICRELVFDPKTMRRRKKAILLPLRRKQAQ